MVQLLQILTLAHGDEDVTGRADLVKERGEGLVDIDEARRGHAGLSQRRGQDAVQVAGLRIGCVDDQVNPVIAVNRHREHAGGGEPRLGGALLGTPHGQRRQVGELRGRGQGARAGLTDEDQDQAGEDADDGRDENQAGLRGRDLVTRRSGGGDHAAGGGVVGGELLGILGKLGQLGTDLGGTRILLRVAVLVGQGGQAGELGLQSLDLLVDAGGHLVGALLDEGGALGQVSVGDRVSGVNGLLARGRHVLDLDDRAVRVAGHLHVGTKLLGGNTIAEAGSRDIEDGGGLRNALLGHHIRRVRQGGAHGGGRRDGGSSHGHRHGRRVRRGDTNGGCNTYDQAGHRPRNDRGPAACQRVTKDLLAARGRRGQDHDCSPWR